MRASSDPSPTTRKLPTAPQASSISALAAGQWALSRAARYSNPMLRSKASSGFTPRPASGASPLVQAANPIAGERRPYPRFSSSGTIERNPFRATSGGRLCQNGMAPPSFKFGGIGQIGVENHRPSLTIRLPIIRILAHLHSCPANRSGADSGWAVSGSGCPVADGPGQRGKRARFAAAALGA